MFFDDGVEGDEVNRDRLDRGGYKALVDPELFLVIVTSRVLNGIGVKTKRARSAVLRFFPVNRFKYSEAFRRRNAISSESNKIGFRQLGLERKLQTAAGAYP